MGQDGTDPLLAAKPSERLFSAANSARRWTGRCSAGSCAGFVGGITPRINNNGKGLGDAGVKAGEFGEWQHFFAPLPSCRWVAGSQLPAPLPTAASAPETLPSAALQPPAPGSSGHFSRQSSRSWVPAGSQGPDLCQNPRIQALEPAGGGGGGLLNRALAPVRASADAFALGTRAAAAPRSDPNSSFARPKAAAAAASSRLDLPVRHRGLLRGEGDAGGERGAGLPVPNLLCVC
nr:uncharacterized protein LOC112982795 [Dromaius novaehollandiae]